MAEYKTKKSAEMFVTAQSFMPGGVSSIARNFPPPFANPPFFESGKGSRLWDIDGNEYVDYALAYGPLILGHRNPELTKAVVEAIENRTSTFGICCDLEYLAAEKIVKHMPAVDTVRFCNSGTEAVMGAIRLARGFTGKTKIVRFEGHYHGWSDVIHWNARAPLSAIGLRQAPRTFPATNGMPKEYGDTLIIQPWNDLDLLEKTLKAHSHEIAAIISEPLMCNLGGTASKPGYLKGLRDLCTKYDVLLILDEVITGFRLGLQGAQGIYDIKPDITTMAKAIGGGFVVGAFGGRRDIMDYLAHGLVTHAGTYNGNMVAMAAVNSTIGILERPGTYENLSRLGDKFRKGLEQAAHNAGLPGVAQGMGPVSQIWFEETPIVDYRDGAARRSVGIFPLFANAMFKRGVAFNPAQYGVMYISTAHTDEDIDFTIAAAEDACREMKAQL